MILSLISPQKNVFLFVDNFRKSLNWLMHNTQTVELIIVDDNSTDQSYAMIKKLFSTFTNVKVIKNTGYGKIDALNAGYELAKGKYIRFIDGDDFLKPEALSAVKSLDKLKADALSSSFKIKVGEIVYPVGSKFLRLNPYSKNKFHSPPRWNWTIRKKCLDKFFPIPRELPFEDLYIAVNLKFYANKTIASNLIDYIYVQHPGQTYGGINKSSRNLVKFRAKRNLVVLKYLEKKFDLPLGIKKVIKEQEQFLDNIFSLKKIIIDNKFFFNVVFNLKMIVELVYYNINKNIKIYEA